jgi:hypothetical protein
MGSEETKGLERLRVGMMGWRSIGQITSKASNDTSLQVSTVKIRRIRSCFYT